MYDLIESNLITFIQCMPALIGLRILFDMTRDILFGSR